MKTEDKIFERAIIISAILHLLMFIASIIGMPSWFQQLPKQQEVLTCEIVSVKDITNVKSEEVAQKKIVEQKNAKRIEKTVQTKPEPKPEPKQEIKDTPKPPIEEKEEEKPKEVAPKPPVEEKEAIALKDKKEKPKPVPEKEKPKEKEKPAVKPKAQKTPPPVEQKPKPKPEVDAMDSIFKNLEESTGDNNSNQVHKNTNDSDSNKHFRSDNYNANQEISITEKNLIKNSIERNWHKPTSLPISNNIVIVFEIEFEKTGEIKRSSHVESHCNHPGQVCQIALESVQRAINKTKVINNLPVSRYDLWKVVVLHFDLDLF